MKIVPKTIKVFFIILTVIVALGVLLIALYIVNHNAEGDRLRNDAKKYFYDNKTELLSCIDKILPALEDYAESDDVSSRNHYGSFIVEDDDTWRVLYGDDIATGIHRLCKFKYSSIYYSDYNKSITFKNHNGPWNVSIMYYFEDYANERLFGWEALGDRWYLLVGYAS